MAVRGAQASMAAVWLAAGCEARPLPPDFGGDPLWHELQLEGAEDLGGPTGAIAGDDRESSGPIRFSDVSDAVGLGGHAMGGNTHGVGAAFLDLDGDEWADIVIVGGRSNVTGTWSEPIHLRNDAAGGFEDAAEASGVAAILSGVDAYSIAGGDVDSDGDVDLYVGAQPRDVLLRNLGDGTFEDATEATGAGGPPSNPGLVGDGKSKIVSLGDFDGDGLLDLLAASSTLPAPGAYLLRNVGDGTFEDMTAASGLAIHPSGNPCAVMWNDIDGDADPDLWIWNDRGGKVLLRNDDGARLSDITAASGVSDVDITHPMGIDAADIDHDGDLDIYVSNIRNNPLLRNNGDGTFSDITRRADTGGEYGWGLALEDFDADGWVDIFVAQEDDAPELVFRNLGRDPPRFVRHDLRHPAVKNTAAAHNVALAVADYDHDGRVDVLTARTDGSRPTLWRNETDRGTHGFLDVLVRPPSGEVGTGARVVVITGDLVQFRDVTGGSSRASQHEIGVRFGLGHVRGADVVAVLWPDGRQAVVTNVAANTRLVLP